MKVDQLTRHIGAEISDIDLSQPLEAATVQAVQDALMQHQVLFFRDQEMSLAQQVALGRQFGQLYVHPAAAKVPQQDQEPPAKPAANPYAAAVDGYPEIIRIYADDQSAQVAGETWHADVTSEAAPPMGSILRIVQVPPVGGDTLFASMYAAYEALSEPMQQFLCSLTCIHDGVKVYGGRSAFDPSRSYPRSEHPVVRTHPVTGRRALYVSTTFTTRIVQLAPAEGDALLQFLFRHLEQPLFQCRFRWRPQSIAFWDNRCTQHQAQWDYHPHKRIGYRVQLVGDRPFFRP